MEILYNENDSEIKGKNAPQQHQNAPYFLRLLNDTKIENHF